MSDNDNALQPQDESKVQNNSLILARQYNGPIPPPEILEGYERLHPGTAAMMISEHEANSKAIREMSLSQNKARIDKEKRGQYMAFAIVIILCIIACVGIVYDHPLVAGGAILATVASTARAFLRVK